MQRIPGAVLARWLPVWAGRLGLGSSELAEVVHVTPSTMSRWWHGQRGTDALLLAQVLNSLREAGALAGPGEVVAAWHAAGYDWPALRQLLAVPDATHLASFRVWLDEWAAARPEPGGQGARLPRDYVARPALLAAARAALLAEAAAPVVLWGMAGVGKTVLATALGRDPAVRQAFWDGVLWATLGPAPDVPERLLAWCRLLGLPTAGPLTVPQLQQLIAGRLAEPGRRYLLVLDDVWTPEVADLLPTPEPPHGLLITTRDRQLVAAWPGSRLSEVPVMSAGEGGALLGLSGGSPAPAVADEVLALVERHPLAVSLVGKQIKLRGPERVLDQLRAADLRLASLQLSPDLNRTRSVRLALQLSYDALAPADQALYRGLGIFPYGTACSLPPVAAFNPAAGAAAPLDFQLAEVRGRLEGLADRSLLLIADDDAQAPCWRLHTVVHDYARFLLRQTGEWEAARAAFVDYYLGLAHELGQAPNRYTAQLTAEWPNLAGAFEHAWDAAAYDRCAFLLAGLHSWLLLTGRLAALDGWLARLAAVEQGLSEAARGWLAHVRGRRALALGEWDAGAQAQAAVLANTAVEPRLQAFQHFAAAAASLARGDLAAAMQSFAAGKQLAETLADADVDLALLKTGAQLALAQRDWPAALRQIELAAEIAVAQDRRAEFVDLLRLAGGLCRDLGQPAAALAYYQSAWAAVRQVDAPAVELNILVELAPLAATHDELNLARAAAERLRALLQAMDLPEPEARLREGFACQVLAFVAQQDGRLDDALALAQQAVALSRDAADPSVAGDAWRVLAVVQAARGEPAGARQAYTEALAAYKRAGAAAQVQAVQQTLAGIPE